MFPSLHHHHLEHVNLRRAAPLVRQHPIVTLPRAGINLLDVTSSIGALVGTEWPHELGRVEVSGPSQVTEHPYCWKEVTARKNTAKECTDERGQEKYNRHHLLAGQNPPVRGSPGSLAENSTIPPVKQNLFQLCSIPDRTSLELTSKSCVFSLKMLIFLGFKSVIKLSTPWLVRMLS
jgi:hypothetical protein